MTKATILKSNLETALTIAIEHQQKKEREMNYALDSALLGGWKENLEALKKGDLEIKYTN